MKTIFNLLLCCSKKGHWRVISCVKKKKKLKVLSKIVLASKFIVLNGLQWEMWFWRQRLNRLQYLL